MPHDPYSVSIDELANDQDDCDIPTSEEMADFYADQEWEMADDE